MSVPLETGTSSESRTHTIVSGPQTGGAFAVVHEWHVGGFATPIHIHTREAEFFYIESGSIALRVGDSNLVLHEGDSALAPRGIPHAFRVLSDDASFLCFISPAGFERFFDEPLTSRSDGAVHRAALTAVYRTYGVEVL